MRRCECVHSESGRSKQKKDQEGLLAQKGACTVSYSLSSIIVVLIAIVVFIILIIVVIVIAIIIKWHLNIALKFALLYPVRFTN